MIHPKAINKLNALHRAGSSLTPRTFVRAAGLANVLVATVTFVQFCGIALVRHDPRAFVFGLLFVPIMTLVIWVAAAVLYVLSVAPRGRRASCGGWSDDPDRLW